MYKMLLVDDEAAMRNRMIERTDWKQYGFEIVADAENGLDALEKFEKYLPDVIITDIKMPFMDGLELSRTVLEKHPLTKIIILTGFDDFQYAKKAINLNVIDYILKPITHDNIIKVLTKTKNLLDKEYNEKRDITKLKEYYKTSYPIMQNRVLHKFVSGRIAKDTINERLSYYNIDIKDGPYRVGIIALKDSVTKDKVDVEETNRLMLYNLVKDVTDDKSLGMPYIYEDMIVVIFSFKNKKDIGNKLLDSVIREIEQNVEKYLSFNIKVAVGHLYDNLEDIHISYREAKSAFDYASDSNKNEIIYIWDMEPYNRNKFLNTKNIETNRSIKTGSINNALIIINDIFKDIIKLNIPEKDYKFYLLEYAFNIIKNANLQSIEIDDKYSQDSVIKFLKEAKHLEEIKEWIIGLITHVIDEIIKQRDSAINNYTKKAKKYIKDNYKDPDINIEKLCNELYISPNYFCTVFKHTTDTTFTSYLTDTRLEKAKELLKSTDKKSFEIAELIGFSDANYFSYCFKKNVGISPSQYRNK